MAISAMRAAKAICKSSGWTVNQSELQYLLYISHMVYLGKKGIKNPLVEGHFELSKWGPEHCDLIDALIECGSKPIPKKFFNDVQDLHEVAYKDELELFAELTKEYPHDSGAILGAYVRSEGTAWEKNYVRGVERLVISNSDILAEFNYTFKEII